MTPPATARSPPSASGNGAATAHLRDNGTYVQKVTETADGASTVSQRTITVPYAGGAGFAPSMADGDRVVRGASTAVQRRSRAVSMQWER